MKTSTLMPLRTAVGPPMPIMREAVSVRGPLAGNVDLTGNIAFSDIQLPYADFLPTSLNLSVSQTNYGIGDGVASLPRPSSLPFDDELMGFLTVTWIGDLVSDNISRSLWFELEIDIAQSIDLFNQLIKGKRRPVPDDLTIGGICFGGFPYMPYYVTEEGENSANFGLPREVRVSWEHQADLGFVDAENAITRQEPTSHSGVNLFPCGPVKAGILRIRFSDMPRCMIRLPRGAGPTERWACVIPYLYLFEHREGMRYGGQVPAGLLGAFHHPKKLERSYASVLDPAASEAAAEAVDGISPDLLFTTGNPVKYYPLTAAGLVGERRHMPGVPGDLEFFLSQKMETGDQFWLVLAQGGDNARTLAGLSLSYPKSALESVQEIETRVFELDPIGGVSPLDRAALPEADKYATLVAKQRHGLWEPEPTVIRFLRPSQARTLAVCITWLGNEKGRLAFHDLDLIQSAHVTVSPRRSCTQFVSALNFRLIGPDLVGDYAEIGPSGFSLVVDHLVAGETKSILLEAASLYDLVRLPDVQVFSNQRYLETIREVTDEDALTLDSSFEHNRAEVHATGWRRNKSGGGTSWSQAPGGRLQPQSQTSASAFRVEQSGETRSKTEHLGFQSIVDQVRDMIVALGKIIMGPNWNLPADVKAFFDGHTTAEELIEGWEDLWGCLVEDNSQIGSLLSVDGLRTLSLPPYAFPEEFVQAIADFLRDPFSLSADDLGTMIAANPTLGPILAIQGMNFGANFGLSHNVGTGVSLGPISFSGGGAGSAGVSISTSPQLPNMVRTSTTGATGAITYQASKQGCSYAQHRNDSFDDSETYLHYLGDQGGVAGRLRRTITRDLLQPGTRRKRRAGVNVHWQGRAVDIVTGTIPLNVTLPATADKIYRTSDEAVRVRFPNGVGSLQVDVWFDLVSEVIKDDY